MDVSGARVPGASVMLFSDERLHQTTTTDASGAFELTGVAPGTYDLDISYPGFKTRPPERLQINDRDVGPLRIKLEVGSSLGACYGSGSVSYEKAAGGASVTGTVIDGLSNAPAPGIIVDLEPRPSSDGVKIRVTSDAKGNFEFPKEKPGQYVLEATGATNNYLLAFVSLRITRQNLTRITIELARDQSCANR